MDIMFVSPSGLEILQPDCDYRNHCHTAETERNRIYTLVLELLEYSHRVPAVRAILDGIVLPEEEGATLASILESIASNDGETMFRIRGLDNALTSALATLAEHNLHSHSQPSRARKRKRTEFEAQEEREIQRNDVEDVIHAALKSLQNNIIDPALLTTLQLRLHTIFVSAISTLTLSTPANVRETLSKMSKLIQLLGVLSNLQLPIIPVPTEGSPDSISNVDLEAGTSHSLNPAPALATHPCPHPACLKTFQKAYDLRIHSRVHANHRPFTCPRLSCPATFTRSHDLQRHVRTHPAPAPAPEIQTNSNLTSSEGVSVTVGGLDAGTSIPVAPAVRCTICQRTFSRRDAFLRHTRGGRGKKAGDGNDSAGESRPRCAAALGENVVNLPSTSTSTRKRASQWDKSRANPPQTTELARLGTTGLETLDQPAQGMQSDPNDPFSIFSEMDFAQMEIDLGQLLALPQFAEHIPEFEL